MHRFRFFIYFSFLFLPSLAFADEQPQNENKLARFSIDREQFSQGFLRGSGSFIAAGWIILAGKFLDAGRETMLGATLVPIAALACTDTYRSRSYSKAFGYATSVLTIPVAAVSAIGWLATVRFNMSFLK